MTYYNILHSYGKPSKPAKDNLIIYDISGQRILDADYERQPRHFVFCDGLVLVINPLDFKTSDNSFNQFIIQYRDKLNIPVTSRSSTPLAIIISNYDNALVKGGIESALNNIKGSPADENERRNESCRLYLDAIGLGNMVLNIDGSFNNVEFFPMSSKKGAGADTSRHSMELLAPIAWVAQQSRSRLYNLFIGKKPSRAPSVISKIIDLAHTVFEHVRAFAGKLISRKK